jgi:hypothetical protein
LSKAKRATFRPATFSSSGSGCTFTSNVPAAWWFMAFPFEPGVPVSAAAAIDAMAPAASKASDLLIS